MRNGWLIAGALVIAAGLAPVMVSADSDDSDDTYKQLDLFGEVFERVRAQYVEPVSDEQLIEAAIQGMLSSLDPHSSYMNDADFSDMQVQTRGSFGGLGIEVTMQDGLVKVVSPMDGTPAADAGLEPGDLITHLDGEPVMGLTLNDAVEKMRGPVGSPITLSIVRGEAEPFDVTLNRAVIRLQSVRSHAEGNVGYIRIASFTEQTQSGLEAAVTSLKTEIGDKLVGYVLDLRNNPGGLLDQAISVSDSFLNEGEIVSTRGRNDGDARRYNAQPGDLLDGKPLIVLINGGSASASEIVAGALQDHHRAVLLGTQSFGKGSVQTIIQLPGHGAMRLTTARYYTPSGRSIQALGIVPDIVVEQARLEEIDQPDGRREADLRGALINEDAAPATTEEAPAETPPQPGAEPQADTQPPAGTDQDATETADGETAEQPFDYQLTRAVDLLRGISLFGQMAAQMP